MLKTISDSPFRVRIMAALLLTTTAACLTGCGLGSPFAADPTNQAIGGIAHGGRQPIASATVTIWSPGIAGYGSAATQLASKTTDGTGNFSFVPGDYTTSCTAGMPVYITIQGGNPGNSTGNANADILLAAPLGMCGSLSTFTDLNEMTTVATAFALSGFINPANFGKTGADAIGTTQSATPTFAANNNNVTGMINAFNTVFNMVNTSTGLTPGAAANATVDTAKITTMANILAACVNSDPTNGDTICSSLFTAVSPTVTTGTPKATNVFEAAYYLATNPTSMTGATSNLSTVYGTAVPNAPYSGGLGAQPTDWTIGINYAVSGLTAGQRLAIDNDGNVWVTSTGQISELSPTGSVLTTYTGALGTGTPVTITSPYGVAMDLNGNVLVTDSGTNTIYQFNTSGFIANIPGSTTTSEEPYAIAIDGTNNAWITEMTSTADSTSDGMVLVKCAYASGAYCTGTSNGQTGAAGAFGIAIDPSVSNTIWTADQYSPNASTSSGTIRSWNNPAGGGATNYVTANGGKAYFPIGIVFDSSSNIYFSNAAFNNTNCSTNCGTSATKSFVSKDALTYSGTSAVSTAAATTSVVASAAGVGGLNIARFIAIDGSNNLWVANSGPNSTTYSVSELNSSLTAISPATTGFVHTMNLPNDIAVDASGNVWVTSSGAVSYVTEIVGAASPTVTPIAYNTKYNTWGQKP